MAFPTSSKTDPKLEAIRKVNQIKETIDVNLEYLHLAVIDKSDEWAEEIKADLDTLHKELNRAQQKLRELKK